MVFYNKFNTFMYVYNSLVKIIIINAWKILCGGLNHMAHHVSLLSFSSECG